MTVEQDPGDAVSPLWSLPLSADGADLSLLPGGGFLVTSATSAAAFGRDGTARWETPISGGPFSGTLTDLEDGHIARIEGDSVVTRTMDAGLKSGSFPTPGASNLSLAPWGDLLYSAISPNGTASVYCVDPAGSPRWSVPVDDMMLIDAPFALGDRVVIARRGMLWAYDRSGQSRWVADQDGIREPRPIDDRPRPRSHRDPEHGTSLFDDPVPIDFERVAVGLQSYSRTGWYLLDAGAVRLTRLGGQDQLWRPFAVLPHPPTEFRIAWWAGKITVSTLQWRYLIVSSEPDGRRLWEHRLPAEPIQLAAAPGGHLIAAATATAKRWRDYGPYYKDLSDETFVRCIGPDGTARWTWHANGPITHPPVVDSDGTIYVGAEQKIWALATPG